MINHHSATVILRLEDGSFVGNHDYHELYPVPEFRSVETKAQPKQHKRRKFKLKVI